MKRHPELSVREAQGMSNARTKGMNYIDVADYFKLLKNVLVENDLI